MNDYKTVVWVIGASGRLGRALIAALKKEKKYTIIGTDLDVDITDIKALEQAAAIYKPRIVINCASLSDDEYCQEHRLESYRVNALGARNVAIVSRQQNAKLIHFSTDDVFSGEHDRPKNEFDVPTPTRIYGLSKLAGENMVRELNPKHLIIRSSWLYGIGANDYFSKVTEYGKKGEKFEAAVDKLSSPTSIDELVKFFLIIIESDEYGIFHASCNGVCSRYEFATTILSLMGYDPSLAQAAMRQMKGGRTSTPLENLMMEITGIYKMPDWREAMVAYVERLKGEQGRD